MKKNTGIDSILGGFAGNIGSLIESLGKLAENSPLVNLTEEQKERLAQAKEALGKTGHQVFDAGPFQVATKFNLGSASKRQEKKEDDSWEKKTNFTSPPKSQKSTEKTKEEKIMRAEEDIAFWKEELAATIKEFGVDSLSDELRKMAKDLGIEGKL